MCQNLLGIISVDFDATDQLLIMYCVFGKYLKIVGIKWGGTI
jgi:hypothetical protein